MIEALNMPATLVAIQVFFFLCASREKTGVVWDSGENVSRTILFFAGLAWPHTILLLFCAPTKFLVKTLIQRGHHSFRTLGVVGHVVLLLL